MTIHLPLDRRAESGLDEAMFHRRVEEVGRHANAMMDMVERDARRRLGAIEIAHRRGDPRGVATSATSLAAVLGYFGMARAAHLASQLADAPTNANPLIVALETTCEELFRLVAQRLAAVDSRAARGGS